MCVYKCPCTYKDIQMYVCMSVHEYMYITKDYSVHFLQFTTQDDDVNRTVLLCQEYLVSSCILTDLLLITSYLLACICSPRTSRSICQTWLNRFSSKTPWPRRQKDQPVADHLGGPDRRVRERKIGRSFVHGWVSLGNPYYTTMAGSC